MGNLVWERMKKLMVPIMKSHKDSNEMLPLRLGPQTLPCRSCTPAIIYKNQEPKTTHNDEKIALVLALAGGFAIWNMFR